MTTNEAVKQAWQSMKDRPVKERLRFFWDYYKWHTIAAVVLVVFLVSYISAILAEPDFKLNGLLLNAYSYSNYEQVQEECQTLANAFTEDYAIDQSVLEVVLDPSRVYYTDGENTSYNSDTLQLILTYTAADALDFIVGDQEAMMEIAYMEVYRDLHGFLNEEQLEAYDGDILYIDYAVVVERQEALDRNLDDSDIVYPDPTDPEGMAEPIPVLIRVSDSQKLRSIYTQSGENLFLGFTGSNKSGLDIPFLEYLLESE